MDCFQECAQKARELQEKARSTLKRMRPGQPRNSCVIRCLHPYHRHPHHTATHMNPSLTSTVHWEPPYQYLFVANPDLESSSLPAAESEFIDVDDLEANEPQATVRPCPSGREHARYSVVSDGLYEFVFPRDDDPAALASLLTLPEPQTEPWLESHSGSQSGPPPERQPRPQRQAEPEGNSLDNSASSLVLYPPEPLRPSHPQPVNAVIVDIKQPARPHQSLRRIRGEGDLRKPDAVGSEGLKGR